MTVNLADLLAGRHMTDDAEHEVYVTEAMAEHLARKVEAFLDSRDQETPA